MAAATAHLPDSAASQAAARQADRKLQRQMSANVEPAGQSDELIRLALVPPPSSPFVAPRHLTDRERCPGMSARMAS